MILGKNGSGKSSLLKLIDKRCNPSEGEIFVCQKLINKYEHKNFSNLLATLNQDASSSLFPSLTIHENCQIANQNQFSKLRYMHFLEDFNSNLSNNMDNLVMSLSGGEKQALALALVCLRQPKILLLDEHTSALDPHAAEKLMQITYTMIKKYNITCLLITHNLEFAQQYGSRLIAVDDGKIVKDYNHDQKTQLKTADLKNFCYS